MISLYINWVDLVVIFLLVVLIWRGIKDGFVTLFLAVLGFFGGLFLAGGLFPHLLPIHDHDLLASVNGNLVLIFATFLGFVGLYLGRRLHLSFGKSWLHHLETGLSVIFGMIAGLIAIWLLASMIIALPFETLSNSVNDSLIVQTLVRRLPPAPIVFSEFDRQLNPNIPVQIFIHSKFQTQRYVPKTLGSIKKAAALDERSVVRITSFGCSSIISGSGFVIAPNLVITNAHNIAGVRTPIVKYGSQSYDGLPVLFDPGLDIAVLRTRGLRAKPLTIFSGEVSDKTTVAALGYPGDNYAVLPGTVIDKLDLPTKNIYGRGSIVRQVYEVNAAIAPGSSGGPIILLDGQVAGLVFAKSSITRDLGYALTSTSLLDKIDQANSSTRRVGTGVCFSK